MLFISKYNKFNKYKLPKCPYCNSKLWYSEIFILKNNTNMYCPHCGKKSEIILRTEIYQALGFTESICLVIFELYIFKGGGYCLLGLVAVILLFTGFYVFSPFCVRLKSTEILNNNHNNTNNINNFDNNEIFSN